MDKTHLQTATTVELLEFYENVIDILKQRNIIRTNNLVGDYTEWLVAQKMDLELVDSPNHKGYDAVDINGARFQIKGRRHTRTKKPRKLSNIKDYEAKQFDFLIMVIFNKDFTVKEAYQIPYGVVSKYIHYNERHRVHTFDIRVTIKDDPEVENITNMLN